MAEAIDYMKAIQTLSWAIGYLNRPHRVDADRDAIRLLEAKRRELFRCLGSSPEEGVMAELDGKGRCCGRKPRPLWERKEVSNQREGSDESTNEKALPPSVVEPEIRQFVDVVTGDPMLAVKIPQFVSRDSNEMLWHTVRALDKLRNELLMRYWTPDSKELKHD